MQEYDNLIGTAEFRPAIYCPKCGEYAVRIIYNGFEMQYLHLRENQSIWHKVLDEDFVPITEKS